MIRVVLDANIIASGFPAKTGPLRQILNLWLAGSFELVMSDHIFEEVERTWQKPYWLKRFSDEDVVEAFISLHELSDEVMVEGRVPRIASHWHDDHVIATAVRGGAGYLVTGDKELRAVGEYQGVKIRTPQEFLEEFEGLD